jgi:hypothetical protein
VIETTDPFVRQPEPAASGRARPPALSRLIVSAYKLVGFVVLTAILVGLASYLGLNLFYLFNHTWVAPAVISPTDERVLRLSAELAQEASARDKLQAERGELVARLHDADRIVDAQARFQRSYRRAIEVDRSDRQAQLAKLRRLHKDYERATTEIERSNDAYAHLSRQRGAELAGAHLIERDAEINGNYQAAQIAHSNLALAEKTVELDARATTLKRETQALGAALGHDGRRVSYDVLRIEQEFERSLLELERARDSRAAIAAGVTALDASIERYDRIIETIRASPYLRAIDHDVMVAFVPYDDLPSVHKGETLFGCRVAVVACRPLGRVRDVLPGEVSLKHPLHNAVLRGQMVEIEVDDKRAVELPVLFSGQAPLFW